LQWGEVRLGKAKKKGRNQEDPLDFNKLLAGNLRFFLNMSDSKVHSRMSLQASEEGAVVASTIESKKHHKKKSKEEKSSIIDHFCTNPCCCVNQEMGAKIVSFIEMVYMG
jgi:hypothetical protein